tara:strand:- start:9990 stop:10508 length:519 start_codon:yes stop_codon:yes gene_type:complete
MTVYLDMDGVIADFFGAVEKLYGVDHWKSIKHRDGIFVELRNTDFFNTLPCFKGHDVPNDSQRIVAGVKSISGGDWGICSSPLRDDEYNSAYWKRKWLEKWNFLPDLEKLIFTSNKHKYAYSKINRRPNILIDDKPENIKRWEEAGGEGILFQCNEDDIDEYLFEELRRLLS